MRHAEETLEVSVIPMLLVALVPDAAALVWTGTPVIGFRIDRPGVSDLISGEVVLDELTVHYCDSTTVDYPIGAVIDPVAGYERTISGGDLCGATWHFSTIMEVDGSGFQLEIGDASVYTPIIPSMPWVTLSDVDVVGGSMSGDDPALITWLD